MSGGDTRAAGRVLDVVRCDLGVAKSTTFSKYLSEMMEAWSRILPRGAISRSLEVRSKNSARATIISPKNTFLDNSGNVQTRCISGVSIF